MKKIITIVFTAIGCISGQCSAGNIPTTMQVIYYQVDQTLFYDITGCAPASHISFYSAVTGGVRLKDMTTDDNGRVLATGNTAFGPAFVLNTVTSPGPLPTNNSSICFLENKAFTLDHLAVKNENGNIQVSWNASVNPPDDYRFEILKSRNGGPYTLLATTVPLSAYTGYAIDDPYEAGDKVSYELSVVAKSSVVFTSAPMDIAGQNNICLYPTATRDNLTIVLADAASNTWYTITDQSGRILQKAAVKETRFSLSVAQYPAGNYILRIVSDKQQTSLKFVKY